MMDRVEYGKHIRVDHDTPVGNRRLQSLLSAWRRQTPLALIKLPSLRCKMDKKRAAQDLSFLTQMSDLSQSSSSMGTSSATKPDSKDPKHTMKTGSKIVSIQFGVRTPESSSSKLGESFA